MDWIRHEDRREKDWDLTENKKTNKKQLTMSILAEIQVSSDLCHVLLILNFLFFPFFPLLV